MVTESYLSIFGRGRKYYHTAYKTAYGEVKVCLSCDTCDRPLRYPYEGPKDKYKLIYLGLGKTCSCYM